MNAQHVRELGAHVLAQPDSLVQMHRHRILRDGFSQQPHAHVDILQLDVFIDCDGILNVGDERHRLQGPVAAAYEPGVRHAYQIRPRSAAGSSILYTLKIRLPANLNGAGWSRPQAVQCLASHPKPLLDALERLYRMSLLAAGNELARTAVLIEALAWWPADGGPTLAAVPPRLTRTAAGDPLSRALDLIENSFARPRSVTAIAAAVGISRRQLERLFKAACGVGPQDYLDQRRITIARENLSQDRLPIHQVAKELGFASAHHFSRWFTRNAGLSPTAFRKQAAAGTESDHD